ncbi:class I SAM-dependent methyltransferase [Acidisphaera sp. S103]|uniref:class I SAM-dependent methyltransferase n=1 Tax=Acidisphaera sp. S103 TaxID=1747223 RepID=UPI00131BB526|nr:methyltransferase domain-containing protein [Acidisphaera sp. S103]
MADAEAIRAFEHAGWERAAGGYEASFATATRTFIPALLDAAGVEAGQSVLDVACGPGFVTAGAAERGAIVRGLDFSAAMLGVARTRHRNIVFDQGDAEALPYPEGHFDAVISNFGIHHVPRPIEALRQAYRVLRPGGRLAFTIWAAPSENIAWKLVFDAIRSEGDMAASRAPAPGGGFGTPTDCESALEQAGFTGISSRKLTGLWHHANGRALLDALRAGTARMAALIEAQSATDIPGIVAAIDRAAAAYRDADGLAIPIAAFVAYGHKA